VANILAFLPVPVMVIFSEKLLSLIHYLPAGRRARPSPVTRLVARPNPSQD
jgi:hypothetical protein